MKKEQKSHSLPSASLEQNVLLSAGNHKWETISMLNIKSERCIKCHIERFKTKLGWHYEWVENGKIKGQYARPACR